MHLIKILDSLNVPGHASNFSCVSQQHFKKHFLHFTWTLRSKLHYDCFYFWNEAFQFRAKKDKLCVLLFPWAILIIVCEAIECDALVLDLHVPLSYLRTNFLRINWEKPWTNEWKAWSHPIIKPTGGRWNGWNRPQNVKMPSFPGFQSCIARFLLPNCWMHHRTEFFLLQVQYLLT